MKTIKQRLLHSRVVRRLLNAANIKNEFGRNVATLMTGTTLAQALPIAASPLLSRMYGPEEFGVLGLYVAICAVLSVLAAGRYEMAIIQPEDTHDAANIAALCIVITLITGVCLWLVIFAFGSDITAATHNDALARWLYLLPASVMITSFYQILNYWNNRHKRFKQLALSRAFQSAATVSTQSAVGYTRSTAAGLITGYFLGQVCGLAWLLHSNRLSIRQSLQAVNAKAIKNAASRYRKFPLFSSWGALLDTAALQLPLLVIAQVFGFTVTGLFSFTFRVLTMPLNLISGSIGQVLFQRVAELHIQDPSRLKQYLLRIFFVLLGISAVPVLMFTFFGVQIFSFVFGDAWAHAGSYAGVLIIAAAARFTVSPLSVVLSLDHNVKKGVLWQVCYFVTLATVLFSFSESPIEVFLIAFAVHEIIQYAIYLAIILWAAGQGNTTNKNLSASEHNSLSIIRKP